MLERRQFIQGLTAAAALNHLPGIALNQFNSRQPEIKSPADGVNSLEEDVGFGTRIKVMGVALAILPGHCPHCNSVNLNLRL